ncbi:unnamed protein product [Aureobasidium uvarum]|uniref:Protein kinase domain-containing protein n=1 Tax=Aureobasidium uvarum TaxID=2773716 RepID=A0A9N8KSA9_9PEZI|nr:unnamed protein product [Aureobasidium uvarum]
MGQRGENDSSGLPKDDEGTWKGGFFVGQGGNGVIHYWVNVDEFQKVRDRMVIKDDWVSDSNEEPEAYRGLYEDLVKKGMDFGINPDRPGKAKIEERFNREAYLQAMLTDPDSRDSATTVPLRGIRKGHDHEWRIPNGDTSKKLYTHWRFYMDLFHAGDLHGILASHIVGEGDNKKPIPEPIPEPFIWCVFTCIAEALAQSERVVQTRPNARQEQDEVITFVDMKPPNMLLYVTRRDKYPVYPKPLLSDFGAAHILYKEDPRQNRNHEKPYSHGATVGFFAPEMVKRDIVFKRDKLAIERPLHSWTNVWQTGRTIESMMHLRTVVREDQDEICIGDCPIKDKDPIDIKGFPDFKYSDDLIDLVWRCQRFEPEQRPTTTELLELIQERALQHSRGMDTWADERNIPQGCAINFSAGSGPNTVADSFARPKTKDEMDGYW